MRSRDFLNGEKSTARMADRMSKRWTTMHDSGQMGMMHHTDGVPMDHVFTITITFASTLSIHSYLTNFTEKQYGSR